MAGRISRKDGTECERKSLESHWKAIGKPNLSSKELRILLVEVESVINARPLMYVQDDSEIVNYALTPSYLMYGRKIVNLPNSSHH